MGLQRGDSVRNAEVKIKQCENPLEAVYANPETCQIPTCLLHDLIDTKIEYGLEFQFEYFILHLKSGLLIYSMGVRLTWLTTIKSFMIRTALGRRQKLGGAAKHLIDGSEKRICRLSFEFWSPHVIERRSKSTAQETDFATEALHRVRLTLAECD